jgi:hypothetical protein
MLRFSNFGKAIVASAPSGATGLNFTVEAGKGVNFPALDSGDYFYGIFKDASGNREIVKIEARSGDAMTIAVGGRGLDGTTPRTWNAGDYFVAGLTNVALQESLSNANLTALGALSSAADKLAYFTGSGTAALADLSAFARTLLDDANAAAMRATLGVATSTEIIPTGTSMFFFQAAAPVGWTKDANPGLNHAIRVTGGTGGGTGGSVPFTTAFASKSVTGTVGNTTLTIDQIPPHDHFFPLTGDERGADGYATEGSGLTGKNAVTLPKGGGLPHTHSFTGTAIDMSVFYINVIIASKD